MKKLIVPILSLLLFSACGNKSAENGSETAGDSVEVTNEAPETTETSETGVTKDGAKAFVETVYKNYFNPSKEDEDKIDDAELTIFGMAFMDKYMSDNLQQKIVDAYDKQIEDEDIFFGCDIWINAQDEENLTLKEVNCIEFVEGSETAAATATVEVLFTNFGEENKAYVVVEYNKEKNSWFVSDFIDPHTSQKLTKQIEDYISGE